MADDPELQKLLEQLQENPDSEALDKLPLETLNALNKKLDPYNQYNPDQKDTKQKTVLLSLTHLREDYQERLLTTSMIGFLYTVAKEYSPDAALRRWTPTLKKTDKLNEDNPTEVKREPFSIDKTITNLKKILAAAELVKTEQQELKKIREQKHNEEILMGNKITEAFKNICLAEKQRENIIKALEYSVCYESRLHGIAADVDMDETLAALKTLPEAEDILTKSPPRAVSWVPRNHTFEVPDTVCKKIIKDFLHTWFEFDPNNHVRSAHNESKINRDSSDDHRVDLKDPERPTVTSVKQKPKVDPADHTDYLLATKDKHTKDAVLRALRDPDVMALTVKFSKDQECANRFNRYLSFIPMDSEARPMIDVIPPQDTYHRFEYYRDVNYEEMRTAVSAIYDTGKPDFEDAILVYKYLEGTQEEVEKERKDYCIKNQDAFKSDVLAIDVGKWNFTGPFKRNRDKIDFYNKNTEIIKRIMTRIEDDKQIGKELMKQRVIKKKAENIKQAGPDAPGLANYRAENKEMLALNANRVLDKEKMLRLEKANGNVAAMKELEYLDQKEKRKGELEEVKKTREFTGQEEREYREVLSEIEKAREMLNVPENAIQVDVFRHNAATGEFTKSAEYTKAEAPEFMEEQRKEQMKLLQNSPLAMIPGPHQALIQPDRPETKHDGKKQ